MATRLIDKLNSQDPQASPVIVKRSPVSRITNDSSAKDKQISAKVNETVYQMFTNINKAQGLSNNSALNMIINKYVRENKGILENEI